MDCNRFIWADDNYLIAESEFEAQRMTTTTAEAINRRQLRRKAKYPHYLTAGNLEDDKLRCATKFNGKLKPIPQPDTFAVLGTRLDSARATPTSLEARMTSDEAVFWKYFRHIKNKQASIHAKNNIWANASVNCLLYDSGAWHTTGNTIEQTRTWGLHHVRKLTPTPPTETR